MIVRERCLFADGHEFGDAGAYERLSGTVVFRVDPKAEAQQGVVDIEFAPTDEDGLVRFEADFCILKPVDLSRGNRRLFFDYGNRGNKRALQFSMMRHLRMIRERSPMLEMAFLCGAVTRLRGSGGRETCCPAMAGCC